MGTGLMLYVSITSLLGAGYSLAIEHYEQDCCYSHWLPFLGFCFSRLFCPHAQVTSFSLDLASPMNMSSIVSSLLVKI